MAAEEEEASPETMQVDEADADVVESEKDAAADSRPKVDAGAVHINAADSTVNVLSSNNDRLLSSLTANGWQHLLAGARCSVGLVGGRYHFEVRVLEAHPCREPQQQSRAPMPWPVLKIGLTQQKSSPLLGDWTATEGQVYFDSEGNAYSSAGRNRVSGPWRHSTIGCVVNLEAGSPNSNTISLFVDGVRCGTPQRIPDAMLGQPLFPTLTYRSATVQVNFGPVALAPLPFTCTALGSAAKADVKASTVLPPSGPSRVVVPVGLPGQGYFDWVDQFLEQNPGWVELSDRKIAEWAEKSGLWRVGRNLPPSIDKPDAKFNVPGLDDLSAKKLLLGMVAATKANFVVAELKANLSASERKALLQRFAGPAFKKEAKVIVGEPSAEFKARVQQLMLDDKKRALAAERKKKVEEEHRRKYGGGKGKGKAKGEEEAPAAPPSGDAESAEVVCELTEEEKAAWYKKSFIPDVMEQAVVASYAEFSLPSSGEGFDSVDFEWAKQDAAQSIVKEWVFNKKLTQRVESIAPGQGFKDAWATFWKGCETKKKLQGDWKEPAKRKELIAQKIEALKPKEEEGAEEKAEKGDEPTPVPEPVLPEVDAESLEVLKVSDVDDIGSGEPLFANFAFEDWALLVLRFELVLLIQSFQKDVNDPDRKGFTERDLGFYYQKYFRKPFAIRTFGVDSFPKLFALIKDSVTVDPASQNLVSTLPEGTDLEHFVKLAEENRRIRQRRAEAGDENAELKFSRPTPTYLQGQQQGGRPQYGKGGYLSGGKGGPPLGGMKRAMPTAAPTVAPTAIVGVATPYVAKRRTLGSYWKR